MTLSRYLLDDQSYVLDSENKVVYIEENGKLRNTNGSFDDMLNVMNTRGLTGIGLADITIEDLQRAGSADAALLAKATGR